MKNTLFGLFFLISVSAHSSVTKCTSPKTGKIYTADQSKGSLEVTGADGKVIYFISPLSTAITTPSSYQEISSEGKITYSVSPPNYITPEEKTLFSSGTKSIINLSYEDRGDKIFEIIEGETSSKGVWHDDTDLTCVKLN